MAVTLHRYVALLRAINVGGHAVVKMADLRTAFESFGLSEVSTYIQTGNVLFSSSAPDPHHLAILLAQHLNFALGYQGTVFVLTPMQLRRAAACNPLAPASSGDEQCYLMFLSRAPEAARIQALMGLQAEEYRFALVDKVLYFAYLRTLAGQRRTIDFEKVLGVVGTARNLRVVDKLIELTAQGEAKDVDNVS